MFLQNSDNQLQDCMVSHSRSPQLTDSINVLNQNKSLNIFNRYKNQELGCENDYLTDITTNKLFHFLLILFEDIKILETMLLIPRS